MRILHLVLDSPGEPYQSMTAHSKPFYARFKDQGVVTYYYRFEEAATTVTADEQTMSCLVPGKESFRPGILDKTINALDFFCGASAAKYDYVIRSNASTVINLSQMLPTLEKRRVLYGATHIINAPTHDPADGKVDETSLFPLFYAAGTCIVLHMSMVELLLQYKDRLRRTVIDDRALGMFFKELPRFRTGSATNAAPVLPQAVGAQFAHFNQTMDLRKAFAFRCRHYESTDRKQDIDDVGKTVRALTLRFLDFPRTRSFVQHVRYHSLDITQTVLTLCRDRGSWTTPGTNQALDYIFGDPAVGVSKLLTVTLANGLSLTHNTSWTFMLDQPEGMNMIAC